MATRRSFKNDESFLEKISIGATGTKQVFTDLKSQDHNPIELERGSMSFKIWKGTKIKRIRVPDILCTACNHQFESRAKTTPGISMSHSYANKERSWRSSLNDNDLVALVVCRRSGKNPIDWQAEQLVQYIPVSEMKFAEKNEMVEFSDPKGAQEGYETRIIWPAKFASDAGVIVSVTPELIQYRRQSNNRITSLSLSKEITTIRRKKKDITLSPLVVDGEKIVADQILAAAIQITNKFTCLKSASIESYLAQLSSFSHSERYAAAKALSFFQSPEVLSALKQTINRKSEHIYVQLEAAAGLARYGQEEGWTFIKHCLTEHTLENKLEAVIILGEIKSDISCRLLINVLLDSDQHADIRAGAAWSLGELHNRSSMKALIDSFTSMDENVRIEAARALVRLASLYTPDVLQEFSSSSMEKRAGIAWALSKSGCFSIEDMLNALVDEDARQWVSFILGSLDQQEYIHDIELLKERDPEVYFAVTVLWKIMSSWVYNLEVY